MWVVYLLLIGLTWLKAFVLTLVRRVLYLICMFLASYLLNVMLFVCYFVFVVMFWFAVVLYTRLWFVWLCLMMLGFWILLLFCLFDCVWLICCFRLLICCIVWLLFGNFRIWVLFRYFVVNYFGCFLCLIVFAVWVGWAL